MMSGVARRKAKRICTLGNTAAAAAAYRRALALNPEPWQATSIYQQAFRAADLVGEDGVAAELKAMFSGEPATT